MAIGRLLRGARRARGTDDAASGAARAGEDARHVDFSGDRFRERLTADVAGRLSEQPARAVDAGTSNLALTAKYGGGAAVGATGLYAGSEAYQSHQARQMQESQEATFEEYQAAAEEIRNNDNLTPEEKEQALAELRAAYEQAIGEADPGSPDGWFAEQWDNTFGGMSLTEKVIIAFVVVAIVRAVTQYEGS